METPALPTLDLANPAHVALIDELSLWSALAGEMLLEHVPLAATRVLDLGTGAGFPGLELAERLGAGAIVVGLDPWRTALERACEKARTWPAPGFAPVRGDGARLPLRDRSIELVVSNLGVNNFEQPDAAFAEVRRVLAPGGHVVLSTNLVGHFRELYDAFDAVLARAHDTPARERLAAHVAHRATVPGLSATLVRHGLRVEGVHAREVVWRFRDGAAVLSHHFMRLGFAPAWREIAGTRADAVLDELRAELDARARAAGEVHLTVPLAVFVATAA